MIDICVRWLSARPLPQRRQIQKRADIEAGGCLNEVGGMECNSSFIPGTLWPMTMIIPANQRRYWNANGEQRNTQVRGDRKWNEIGQHSLPVNISVTHGNRVEDAEKKKKKKKDISLVVRWSYPIINLLISLIRFARLINALYNIPYNWPHDRNKLGEKTSQKTQVWSTQHCQSKRVGYGTRIILIKYTVT